MGKRVTVIETNAQGGLIHFAYQMADALSREGADVTLITGPDYELTDLPHSFKVEKQQSLWPVFSTARKPGNLQAAFRKVRRFWRGMLFFTAWTRITIQLLRDKPDGVVLSMIHSPFQVVFYKALRWAKIPLVQICHEIEQRDTKRGLFDRVVAHPLMLASYRSFTAVVVLARSIKDDFRERYGEDTPVVVMPHGPQLIFPQTVETTEAVRIRYGVAPGERIILFFGLLRPSKGVADLVDGFSRLPDKSGLRLVIAGYPTKTFSTEALNRQIETLGIADRVSLYLDYVPNGDVAALLGMADVVVFPYRSATASGAAAAAQSLGRPVVATDVGGFPEAIQDGVTGFLVPPADPGALADAIAKTLADPERAREMALAGRADMLKNRSWAAFARGLIDIFETRPR